MLVINFVSSFYSTHFLTIPWVVNNAFSLKKKLSIRVSGLLNITNLNKILAIAATFKDLVVNLA